MLNWYVAFTLYTPGQPPGSGLWALVVLDVDMIPPKEGHTPSPQVFGHFGTLMGLDSPFRGHLERSMQLLGLQGMRAQLAS